MVNESELGYCECGRVTVNEGKLGWVVVNESELERVAVNAGELW